MCGLSNEARFCLCRLFFSFPCQCIEFFEFQDHSGSPAIPDSKSEVI